MKSASLTHGQPFPEIVELVYEMWPRRDAIVALWAFERMLCLETRSTGRLEQLREQEYYHVNQS
jgi:hypothetical protein